MLQLLQAFGGPGRTALSFAPTYSMYPEYARDTDTRWVDGRRGGRLHARPRPRRRAGRDAAAARRAAAVAQQPDRHGAAAETVEALCEALGDGVRRRRRGVRRVPARRHAERAGAAAATTRNLVVTRTMSKAFALAGARLGYLAADAGGLRRAPHRAAAVPPVGGHPGRRAGRPARTPTSCSARSTTCAPSATRPSSGYGPGPRRSPRATPTSCCSGRFADRHAVWQGLLDRGVLIREIGPDGWLRVSIGTAAEMAAFRDALTSVTATTEAARHEPHRHPGPRDQGVQGPRRGRPRRHRPLRRRDRRRLLRPHARPRSRGTRLVDLDRHHRRRPRTSTPTTPSRTPRSCSARRSREALGDKAGIRRFGDALVPLDEALVQAAVDVSGRPYCVHVGEPDGQAYVVIGGDYAGSLTRHVFETIAFHAQIALHVRVLSGRDPHHLVEAQFKAFARAFRDAVAHRPARDRGARRPRAPVDSLKNVVVLDYGSGNVRSAVRALERAGASVDLTADRATAEAADGLVVPGVGAFAACMAGLRAVRGPARDRSPARRRPTGARHLRRHAGALRARRRARRRDRGLRRVAGRGRAAAGAGRAPHGLEHRGGAARAHGSSPASRASASTSCTPTPRGPGTW